LRPTFELRCGHGPLYEKILRNHPGLPVSFFCRDYLAETFSTRAPEGAAVNDLATLEDDLLIINGQLLAGEWMLETEGEEVAGFSPDGELLYARITKSSAVNLPGEDIFGFLAALSEKIPNRENVDLTLIRYQWELIQYNGQAIASDFKLADRRGILGFFHDTVTIYGPAHRLYVAPEAEIHPQVVIDTHHGPVTIEKGALVFPHSRIEGPCYIGPDTHILRGNIREGCSFGPSCRIGGEVEESIIHGYSNKCHDGFLGHAYVGEWVNLGALTTNSDLKNNYGTVEMYMPDRDGKWSYTDTGGTKVGSFIGDHTKTSIGTLLNTGSNIGIMTLLMGNGKVLPKYIPSFAWFLEGAVSSGFGFGKLMETARLAMGRRKKELSEADRRLLEYLHQLTKPERDKAVRRDRRKLLKS
ncbi:MAG: putative sugar nucleotidyl transferase, partial [Candidatus Glassbacteria bacterium]